MKILAVLIAFGLVFTAGYFSHSPADNISTTRECSTVTYNQSTQNIHDQNPISQPIKPQTTNVLKAQKMDNTNLSTVHNTENNAEKPAQENKSNPSHFGDQTVETTYSKEISDEEIDKILPEPFGKQLKRNHGDIREKYKNFAENTEPLDWDKNMKNKLSDAIFSNPYSKFIKVDSLDCRANLCEIRLYETKFGAWSYIQSGMVLQDWWDIGASSASSFKTDSASGIYVLLAKRQPM